MSTAEQIADLLRQQADLNMKLAEKFDELGRNTSAPSEAAAWVKLREFCDSHGVGESTVRRYIRDGMPHKLLGPRNIRLNVAAAEAWLEDHGVRSRRGGRAA